MLKNISETFQRFVSSVLKLKCLPEKNLLTLIWNHNKVLPVCSTVCRFVCQNKDLYVQESMPPIEAAKELCKPCMATGKL